MKPDDLAPEQQRERAEERETDRAVVRNYLPITQGAMADLTPGDWVRLARLCRAVNSYSGFAGALGEPFRYFFGALAADLYSEATDRGEPIADDSPALVRAYEQRIDRILAESSRRRAGYDVDGAARGPRMGGR